MASSSRSGSFNGHGNDQRVRLLALVEEQPGLNIKELAEFSELSRTATRYHVRRLISEGAVVTRRQGNHVLHFHSGMPEIRRRAVGLLRISSVRAIVEAAMEDAVIDTEALARETGFSSRSIQRSIRMLSKEGLAVDEITKKGRETTRTVRLHGQTRYSWVLWCKRDEKGRDQESLWEAPGWVFGLEMMLGSLLGRFSNTD